MFDPTQPLDDQLPAEDSRSDGSPRRSPRRSPGSDAPSGELRGNRSAEERNADYRFRSTPLARAARTPSPRAPAMNHIHSLYSLTGKKAPAGTQSAREQTKGKCGLVTRKGHTQREMAMGKSERAIVLSTPFEPV